jgi:hypothetical protein
MYCKSVSFLTNIPISHLTYKETSDTSYFRVCIWSSISTGLMYAYYAMCLMQHFHYSSQTCASIYMDIITPRLVPGTYYDLATMSSNGICQGDSFNTAKYVTVIYHFRN